MTAALTARRLEQLIKAEVRAAIAKLPDTATGGLQITSIVIRIAGLPDVTVEPTPEIQ